MTSTFSLVASRIGLNNYNLRRHASFIPQHCFQFFFSELVKLTIRKSTTLISLDCDRSKQIICIRSDGDLTIPSPSREKRTCRYLFDTETGSILAAFYSTFIVAPKPLDRFRCGATCCPADQVAPGPGPKRISVSILLKCPGGAVTDTPIQEV